jgi:hypothetical protein
MVFVVIVIHRSGISLPISTNLHLTKTNKQTNGTTILERGLPICGLRPNHCQSHAKPSEKNHDLPGIRTRDLWNSSQHC